MAADERTFDDFLFQETSDSRELITHEAVRGVLQAAFRRVQRFSDAHGIPTIVEPQLRVLDSSELDCHVVPTTAGGALVLLHSGLLYGVASLLRLAFQNPHSLDGAWFSGVVKSEPRLPSAGVLEQLIHGQAERHQGLSSESCDQEEALRLTLSFVFVHELFHLAHRDAQASNHQAASGRPDVDSAQEHWADNEAVLHVIAMFWPRMEEHIFYLKPGQRLGIGPIFWPIMNADDLTREEQDGLFQFAVGLWCLFGFTTGVQSSQHPLSVQRWHGIYKMPMPMPWAAFLDSGASFATEALRITDAQLASPIPKLESLSRSIEILNAVFARDRLEQSEQRRSQVSDE